eukprot:scaffold115591_cov32-Tisochrysis_lutea.AAC.1
MLWHAYELWRAYEHASVGRVHSCTPLAALRHKRLDLSGLLWFLCVHGRQGSLASAKSVGAGDARVAVCASAPNTSALRWQTNLTVPSHAHDHF